MVSFGSPKNSKIRIVFKQNTRIDMRMMRIMIEVALFFIASVLIGDIVTLV